jgi:hypothetical protein
MNGASGCELLNTVRKLNLQPGLLVSLRPARVAVI